MKREGVWQLWHWKNSGQHWQKQESVVAGYLELVVKAVNTDELSEGDRNVGQTSVILKEGILEGGMVEGQTTHINSFEVTDPSITGTSVNFQRDQEKTDNMKQRAHWNDCPGGHTLSCVMFASALHNVDIDSTPPNNSCT